MSSSGFIHLHVHTQYSLLDGAIRIDALLHRAAEFQMDAVAMTDHGVMYGVVDFYLQAKKAGIKPIIGCEIYIASGSRHDKSPNQKGGMSHLILLAQNIEGYRNLCKLVAAAHLEGFYYKPRIDKELLARYSQGLIAQSACLHGEIPRLIETGRMDLAAQAARAYEKMFGEGNFFLEVQNNGIVVQEKVNQGLLTLSKELSIPLVATNDCHYLNRQDARAHDVLLCIQTGKTVQETKRMKFQTDQLYFKSPEEMKRDFADYPHAIENTVEISRRCNVELEMGTYHFPRFDPPHHESEKSVKSVDSKQLLEVDAGHGAQGNGNEAVELFFEEQVRRGWDERLGEIRKKNTNFSDRDLARYTARLEDEIKVIKAMGFTGYFLVVADFVRYAKTRGIPVGPGRGSAAGSLVAYCLRITDLDPIVHGLIFERFLNPARKSMPDIDVDFCIDGRDSVFKYIVERYGGPEYVAQIITFGKMQARAVIRDVGRALDIPLREVDAIAKLIPDVVNISLQSAISQEPRLRQLIQEDPKIEELMTVAKALEGLSRHASTHAAGVVISDRPLVEHLPLARGKKGEVVTQYDMICVEKIGLVKFDLLGLRNLTVMKHACEIIQKGGGVPPDLENLNLTDQATFDLLASAQTTGVFQLESSGMKDLLRRLRPSCFEDIVALVALYRPGPLDSGMHDAFVERKNGQVSVSYTLPELEPILKDTYGVILYQEQVMNIAGVLADYSMAEADNLRKAMGKKISELMAKERERFLTRAEKKGVDPKKAEEIFDLMEKFGRYGFNKAHSAAYALIAFQTAYLKAHFPVEFLAALLTSEMSSTDAVLKYISECRSQGIEVLPPDINQSDVSFMVSGGAIRFGLAAVKNVGEGAIESIISVRNAGGPFSSLFDFCERVDQRKVNKRVVESLVKCGAFDSTGAKRSQMMEVMEESMEIGQKIQRDRSNGQISLFDVIAGPGAHMAYPPLPHRDEWSEKELLNHEKESLGFFITGHPLAVYEPILKKVATADTVGLKKLPDGCTVRVGGLVRDFKRHQDRKGDLMAFLTLEDLKGFVEVTLFSSVYSEVVDLIREESAIVVEGRMTKDENTVKILGERVVPIEKAEETWTTAVRLNLDLTVLDREKLEQLCGVLRQHEGKCQTYLHLRVPDQTETIIELHLRVKAGKALKEAVKSVVGDGAVETVCEMRPGG